MKLFIWEGDGVLTDYSNGMICALADDLEGALKAIEAECDYCMQSFPNHKLTRVVDLDECSNRPVPVAAVCYGGG